MFLFSGKKSFPSSRNPKHLISILTEKGSGSELSRVPDNRDDRCESMVIMHTKSSFSVFAEAHFLARKREMWINLYKVKTMIYLSVYVCSITILHTYFLVMLFTANLNRKMKKMASFIQRFLHIDDDPIMRCRKNTYKTPREKLREIKNVHQICIKTYRERGTKNWHNNTKLCLTLRLWDLYHLFNSHCYGLKYKI